MFIGEKNADGHVQAMCSCFQVPKRSTREPNWSNCSADYQMVGMSWGVTKVTIGICNNNGDIMGETCVCVCVCKILYQRAYN